MSAEYKNTIRQRAEALSLARSFFAKKNILEVDCIALTQAASIDVNIDLFAVSSPTHGTRFLFSSPEYQVKRMLSNGSGDIFYLGHVWRHEEQGKNHSPEFLMAEWYRLGFSFSEMIEETIAFVELFTGQKPHTHLSYRQAFLNARALDPFTASDKELIDACPATYSPSSRDEALNLLLALYVEPSFDPDAITVLYHYPASQAALSQHVLSDGHRVGERFELYCQGLELANGFHELTDAREQRRRFIEDNLLREQQGKEPYPIDEAFLQALEKGLPDCCGVAVGVDRLLMIQHDHDQIKKTFAIDWQRS